MKIIDKLKRKARIYTILGFAIAVIGQDEKIKKVKGLSESLTVAGCVTSAASMVNYFRTVAEYDGTEKESEILRDHMVSMIIMPIFDSIMLGTSLSSIRRGKK